VWPPPPEGTADADLLAGDTSRSFSPAGRAMMHAFTQPVEDMIDAANNPPREPDGRFTPIGTVHAFDFTLDPDDSLFPPDASLDPGGWRHLDGGTIDIGIMRPAPLGWRDVVRAIVTPSRWQHVPATVRAWRAPPVENSFDLFLEMFAAPVTRPLVIHTTVRRLGPDSVWAPDFDPSRDCDPPADALWSWLFPHVSFDPPTER
jgi:hypothetical protein